MTRRELLLLGHGLTQDSPLFRLLFPDKFRRAAPPTKAQRLWAVLNYPGIGGHVVESYERIALPPLDFPEVIVRAHRWRMNPDTTDDPDIALAWALNQPRNRARRDFLRALHLCRDAAREQLAARAGLSPSVFTFFGELHFNAQDRLDEPLYLAEICRQAGVDPAIYPNWPSADRAHKALWVAHRTGSSELVQVLYSLRASDRRKPVQELRADIEQMILSLAAAKLRREATEKEDNPLLEPALRIISRRTPANAAQVKREEGPSVAQAIRLTLDGLPRPAQASGAAASPAQPCAHPSAPTSLPDQT